MAYGYDRDDDKYNNASNRRDYDPNIRSFIFMVSIL